MSIHRSPDVSLQHLQYCEGNDISSQEEDDILNDSLESFEENLGSASCLGQEAQSFTENYIPNVGNNVNNDNDNIIRSCASRDTEKETEYINDDKSILNKKNRSHNNNNNNKKTNNSSISSENNRCQEPRKTQQNIIEMNRRKVGKGRPKESYSKMHQRRLLETKKITTKIAKNENVENLRKSNVIDDPFVQSANEGILHDLKPVSQDILHLDDAPKENTFLDLEELNTRISIERNELANSNQDLEDHSLNNPAVFENHFYANSYRGLPPIQEGFNSLQSAPAKFTTNNEQPFRPNSLQCISETGYGRLHSKQYTYKPYTYFDYKKMKQTVIPSGGLGPDTNSEEYKEKMKRASKQRDYADVLREKHRSENKHWKKKSTVASSKETTPKTQVASSRRMKALEYAKEVPKPIVAKTRMRAQNETEIVNQGKTLLDILRQRHQKEKEAIDAVRKDLQTKLKS